MAILDDDYEDAVDDDHGNHDYNIGRTLDDGTWDDVTSDDDYLYYDHRDHDSMDGLVLVDVVASAAGQRKPQIEIAIHFTLPKYV